MNQGHSGYLPMQDSSRLHGLPTLSHFSAAPPVSNRVLPGSHGSRIKNSRQLVSQSTTQFGELHLAKYFWPVFVACQMYSPQTGRQNHGTKGTRGTSRSLHCTRHPGATSSPMIHIDIFIFFEHNYVFMCFDIFKYIYIHIYIQTFIY